METKFSWRLGDMYCIKVRTWMPRLFPLVGRPARTCQSVKAHSSKLYFATIIHDSKRKRLWASQQTETKWLLKTIIIEFWIPYINAVIGLINFIDAYQPERSSFCICWQTIMPWHTRKWKTWPTYHESCNQGWGLGKIYCKTKLQTKVHFTKNYHHEYTCSLKYFKTYA